MGDKSVLDFGEGARRCIECGAPVTIIEKEAAVHTAPGHVLIITGDRLPGEAAPVVKVRCTNGHTYSLSTLRSNGGGAT
jgi:hypothetical protein